MRILIDIGHPAHVHYFKNAINQLQQRGHAVFVVAREKEVSFRLLI
jgi:predicted glycosyltransferase